MQHGPLATLAARLGGGGDRCRSGGRGGRAALSSSSRFSWPWSWRTSALCFALLFPVQEATRLGRARRSGVSLHLSAARSRSRGILQIYDDEVDSPVCGCDCCVAESRRPAERSSDITSKCGVPPQGRCPERCSVVNDPVLQNAIIVEMERFCFYRCQPAGSLETSERNNLIQQADASFRGGYLTETPCRAVPENLEAQAVESDGNGRDPLLPSQVVSDASAQADGGSAADDGGAGGGGGQRLVQLGGAAPAAAAAPAPAAASSL